MKQIGSRARRSTIGLACGLFLAMGVVLASGCEKAQTPTKDDKPSEPSAPQVAPVKYTVRGIIKQIPIKDNPRTSLQIHHEAIPTFAKGGKVIGMHEMTMEFPLGPGVSLEGLKVGDKVEFDFEVVESPAMRYYMTRIVGLASDAALNLTSNR